MHHHLPSPIAFYVQLYIFKGVVFSCMILVNFEIKRLASFHNDAFQTYPQLKKGTDLDGLDVIDIGCQCNELHNISKPTCSISTKQLISYNLWPNLLLRTKLIIFRTCKNIYLYSKCNCLKKILETSTFVV